MFQYFNQLRASANNFYYMEFLDQVIFSIPSVSGSVFVSSPQSFSGTFTRMDFDGSGPIAFRIPVSNNNILVDVNDSNNYYVTGIIGSDGYLVKVNSLFNIVWQKRFSSNGVSNIQIDSESNIYVLTNLNNLIKLDTAGNTVWQKNISVSAQSYVATGLVIDQSNNIFVSGRYFVGTSETFNSLIKIDSTGNKVTETRFLSVGTTTVIRNLECDIDGNVYAAPSSGSSLILTKFNNSCVKQFEYTYNSNVSGRSFTGNNLTSFQLNENSFYFANDQGLYLKTNLNGDIQTTRSIQLLTSTGTTTSNISNLRINSLGNAHFLLGFFRHFCIPETMPVGSKSLVTSNNFNNFNITNLTSFTRINSNSVASTTLGVATTVSNSTVSVINSSLSRTIPAAFAYTLQALNY
jgi:hypothetical protein